MVDHAGNVHGWLGKNGEKSAPVVLAAHLDTVFGAEVDVAVERRGQRLEGPGISDNARGLAALVAVAEAMVAARVPAARPILFAATVGEEGSGDLRGVKYLLNGKHSVGAQHAAPLPNVAPLHPTPAAFIALDGAGLDRVIHRALGSKRYQVTFRGPGGHSWAAFGVANPANAVGRAVALLADLPTQQAPRTTCAVVRLGGGTGLNSIPQEAWLDLDLRSEDPRALSQLDVTVRAALERAADDENRRRTAGSPPLRAERTVNASRGWRVARSWDEYTCRTTPVWSITYVTRPGRSPWVFSTPYNRRTAPSRSESSRNGRLWRWANRRCDRTESELTPTTCASLALNCS